MDQKVSPMERRTLNALDSANPFQTPVGQHRSLDGRPVVKAQRPEENTQMKEPPKQKAQKKKESIADILERVEEQPVPVVEPELPKEPIEDNPSQQYADPDQNEVQLDSPEIVVTHDRGGCPSYRTEFVGRDIFVGLPWRRDSHVTTTLALVAMALDFGKDRIRFDAVTNSEVHAARNGLVAKFLETDAKWLFMLDHDMVPSIGRAQWFKAWVDTARAATDEPFMRHVIHRLVAAGKTFVGGAYFGRQEGAPLVCSDQTLAPSARSHADRVVPVDWIGGGCMMIHRKVFEDIAKSNPELNGHYFLPTTTASEDIAFCRLAKAAGHQPHIDLGVPVKHIGYKAY